MLKSSTDVNYSMKNSDLTEYKCELPVENPWINFYIKNFQETDFISIKKNDCAFLQREI
jgi:hypothetical protein